MDLNNVFQYKQSNNQDKKSNGDEPPIIKNSITHNLWKKHLPLSKSSSMYKNSSGINLGMVKEIIDGKFIYIDTEYSHNPDLRYSDEPDFIIRKRSISCDDPCPCRSGKLYRECHGKDK